MRNNHEMKFANLPLSVFLVLCLVLTTIGFTPAEAYAVPPVEINLMTVSASADGYTWDEESKLLTITDNGEYRVVGGNVIPTDRRIAIATGKTVTLFADNLNIVGEGTALDLEGNANLTLELIGENTLGVNAGNAYNTSAIHVPENATLTITGSGSLDAFSLLGVAACIGSYSFYKSGVINIIDTTVTASNLEYGAAIGSGNIFPFGTGGTGGDITIVNSKVVATVNQYAFAIGIGSNNPAGPSVNAAYGSVVISNSNVTAVCSAGYGGGIGGGATVEIEDSAIFSDGIASATKTITDSFVMEGANGTVYGDYELYGTVEVPHGSTLTISTGATLILDSGDTLINNGTIVLDGTGSITNGGTIENHGTISGVIGGTVNNIPTVYSITLNTNSSYLHKTETDQFSVTNLNGGGGATGAVTWSITGNSDSTTNIDQTGLLSIGANETCGLDKILVRATSDETPEVSATAKVSVIDPITSFKFVNKSITLALDDSAQIAYIATPSNAAVLDFEYYSQDNDVAEVEWDTGVVTAVGIGSTYIEISAWDGENDFQAYCKVNVVLPISIEPAPISIVPIPTQTYNGLAKTPALTVKYGSTPLILGEDYSVSYANNVQQGYATVTITGKGIYSGTASAQFIIQDTIAKAAVSAVKDQTWTGKALAPAVTVKHGSKTLTLGTHHTVAYSENKEIGKATVTVSGKGIYSGAKTVTFNILPKATKVSKVTAGKKNLKVTWAKAIAAQKITNYQVRYRVSGTSKWTTKTVAAKKAGLTIKNLKKNKKYQVKVRVCKTVSKVNYCSAWSPVKTSAKVK
jgi:hypothetical protein